MEWTVVDAGIWRCVRRLSFSSISAEIRRVGNDFQAQVFGGDSPHIGCVVLALPCPSHKGAGQTSATASVLNVPEHKDEFICRIFAEQIAKRSGAVAVCLGGFHYDGITKEQIEEVVRAAGEMAGSISFL